MGGNSFRQRHRQEHHRDVLNELVENVIDHHAGDRARVFPEQDSRAFYHDVNFGKRLIDSRHRFRGGLGGWDDPHRNRLERIENLPLPCG